jgi:hypothetical protein
VVLKEVLQEFRYGSTCAESKPKYFPLFYFVMVGYARQVYTSLLFVHIDVLLFIVGFPRNRGVILKSI